MPCYGKQFQAIDLKLCNQKVEPIDPNEMHFYLDTICAGLDIEHCWPTAPTQKTVKAEILGSAGFLQARVRLSTL